MFFIKYYKNESDNPGANDYHPSVEYVKNGDKVTFESSCSFSDHYEFSVDDEAIDVVNNGKPTSFCINVKSLKNGKYYSYNAAVTNGETWIKVDTIEDTFVIVSVDNNNKVQAENNAIISFTQSREGETQQIDVTVTHDGNSVADHIDYEFSVSAKNARSCDTKDSYTGLTVMQTSKAYYTGQDEPVVSGPKETKNYTVTYSPEFVKNNDDTEKDITATLSLTRQTGQTETDTKQYTVDAQFKQLARVLNTTTGPKTEDKSKMELSASPNPATVNKDGESITFNLNVRRFYNQTTITSDACDGSVISSTDTTSYTDYTNPEGVVWSVNLQGTDAKASFIGNVLKVEPNATENTYNFSVSAEFEGKTITIPVTQGKQRSIVNRTYSLSATCADNISPCYTTDKVQLKVYDKYVETYDDNTQYESQWNQTSDYNFEYAIQDWTSYTGTTDRNVGINITANRTTYTNGASALTTLQDTVSFTQKGVEWGSYEDVEGSRKVSSSSLNISATENGNVNKTGGTKNYTATYTENYVKNQQRSAVGCSNLKDPNIITVQDGSTTKDVTSDANTSWEIVSSSYSNITNAGNGSFTLTKNNNQTNNTYTIKASYNGSSNEATFYQDADCIATNTTYSLRAVPVNAEIAACDTGNTFNVYEQYTTEYRNCDPFKSSERELSSSEYTIAYDKDLSKPYTNLTEDQNVMATITSIANKETTTINFVRAKNSVGDWVAVGHGQTEADPPLGIAESPRNPLNIDACGGSYDLAASFAVYYRTHATTSYKKYYSCPSNTVYSSKTETASTVDETLVVPSSWKVDGNAINGSMATFGACDDSNGIDHTISAVYNGHTASITVHQEGRAPSVSYELSLRASGDLNACGNSPEWWVDDSTGTTITTNNCTDEVSRTDEILRRQDIHKNNMTVYAYDNAECTGHTYSYVPENTSTSTKDWYIEAYWNGAYDTYGPLRQSAPSVSYSYDLQIKSTSSPSIDACGNLSGLYFEKQTTETKCGSSTTSGWNDATLGTDYELSYSSSPNTGSSRKITVTYNGLGNYTGKTGTTEVTQVGGMASYSYVLHIKDSSTPSIDACGNLTGLVLEKQTNQLMCDSTIEGEWSDAIEGMDYTISYTKSANAGSSRVVTVTYNGLNNYSSQSGTTGVTQVGGAPTYSYNLRVKDGSTPSIDACGTLSGLVIEKQVNQTMCDSTTEGKWTTATLGLDYTVRYTESPNTGSSRTIDVTYNGLGNYSSQSGTIGVTQAGGTEAATSTSAVTSTTVDHYEDLKITGPTSADSCKAGSATFTAMAKPVYKVTNHKYFTCNGTNYFVSESEGTPFTGNSTDVSDKVTWDFSKIQ